MSFWLSDRQISNLMFFPAMGLTAFAIDWASVSGSSLSIVINTLFIVLLMAYVDEESFETFFPWLAR